LDAAWLSERHREERLRGIALAALEAIQQLQWNAELLKAAPCCFLAHYLRLGTYRQVCGYGLVTTTGLELALTQGVVERDGQYAKFIPGEMPLRPPALESNEGKQWLPWSLPVDLLWLSIGDTDLVTPLESDSHLWAVENGHCTPITLSVEEVRQVQELVFDRGMPLALPSKDICPGGKLSTAVQDLCSRFDVAAGIAVDAALELYGRRTAKESSALLKLARIAHYADFAGKSLLAGLQASADFQRQVSVFQAQDRAALQAIGASEQREHERALANARMEHERELAEEQRWHEEAIVDRQGPVEVVLPEEVNVRVRPKRWWD